MRKILPYIFMMGSFFACKKHLSEELQTASTKDFWLENVQQASSTKIVPTELTHELNDIIENSELKISETSEDWDASLHTESLQGYFIENKNDTLAEVHYLRKHMQFGGSYVRSTGEKIRFNETAQITTWESDSSRRSIVNYKLTSVDTASQKTVKKHSMVL